MPSTKDRSPLQDYGFQSSPRSSSSSHSPKSSYNDRTRPSDLSIRVINPRPKSTIWKVPLPATPTLLLTSLYETLIMARNCEVPTAAFWSKYDTNTPASYTIHDIEHTLRTVGVECNTQTDGKHVSTGRWLLLRHGHFLVRAQQSIVWIDRSQGGNTADIDPEEIRAAPIVWDWKSKTELWRWHAWQEQRTGAQNGKEIST